MNYYQGLDAKNKPRKFKLHGVDFPDRSHPVKFNSNSYPVADCKFFLRSPAGQFLKL